MAYTTKLFYPEKVVDLTLKAVAGVVYSKGDLVGYSSGWVLADADAATNVYAQYILLQGGNGGETVKACKKCLLFDEDAPWTANTAQYLSGTAGATTETRPTTDGDMIQIVGKSLDTSRCLIDIQDPKEFELFFRPGTFNALGGAGAIEDHTIDAGWEGPDADSAAVAGYITGYLPSGLVSLDYAALVVDMQAATALDIDVSMVQSYKGGANNGTGTATTAIASVESAADNKILTASVLAVFDATVKLPGKYFNLLIDPDGGDFILIGMKLRGMKL